MRIIRKHTGLVQGQGGAEGPEVYRQHCYHRKISTGQSEPDGDYWWICFWRSGSVRVIVNQYKVVIGKISSFLDLRSDEIFSLAVAVATADFIE